MFWLDMFEFRFVDENVDVCGNVDSSPAFAKKYYRLFCIVLSSKIGHYHLLLKQSVSISKNCHHLLLKNIIGCLEY